MNVIGSYRMEMSADRSADLSVRVLNAFDQLYETGGYIDFDASGALVPHRIPAATRQVLVELRVNF